MNNIAHANFKDLFTRPTKWIDVRAPVEFAAGAVPGAVNLPLLNDFERHEVGHTYKERGQSAAIELGHRLVGGLTREERIQSWLDASVSPDSVIYCFRGGLRSQTVQSWLHEKGRFVPIIEGGYKALRRFFLSTIESELVRKKFVVVAGPTGSGKTDYLKLSGRPYLDLEALAHHRGSAFGALEGRAQPSQVDFENRIALQLLKLSSVQEPILIENESRMIGRLAIPDQLFQVIRNSEKLVLDVPLERRIENIFKDYVRETSLGLAGDVNKFVEFERAIRAISRKLGGLRSKEILEDLKISRADFSEGRGLDSNRIWIGKLLRWYYDPVYAGHKTVAAKGDGQAKDFN